MKVKNLIKELKKYDQELDVYINNRYTYHTCHDNCYCSVKDNLEPLNSVDCLYLNCIELKRGKDDKTKSIILQF